MAKSKKEKPKAQSGKLKKPAQKPAKSPARKPAAKKTGSSSPKKIQKAASAVKKDTKPVKKTAKPVSKPAASTKVSNPAAKPAASKNSTTKISTVNGKDNHSVEVKMTPFLKKQKDRLLQLRDGMLDSMVGVAKDNLRSRAEGSEASAFGMHQADAGSDAYDRDFALSLLSQEQDALYEIDEALKRIEGGSYGVCEMSGKAIPHARLEAIPFARFTVECQSQIERQQKAVRTRQPVTSLFGLTDDESGDNEDDDTSVDTKD